MSRDFLKNTIGQAKAHGLVVVAEGVETDAIWAEMQSMGADHAQGFLAARPSARGRRANLVGILDCPKAG